MAKNSAASVIDMDDVKIAIHLSEELYNEVPLEFCEQGCTYYEENSTSTYCSLGVFEESLCPPVRAKLVQTRDQINNLIGVDVKELFDLPSDGEVE